MTTLALLLLLQSDVEKTIEKLTARDDAARAAALERWEKWSAEDVAALERVAGVNAYVREVVDRIQVRRAIGKAVLERLPRAEDVLIAGGAEECLRLLREGHGLADADVRRVATCAVRRGWKFEPEVLRTLRDEGLKTFGAIAASLFKHEDESVRIRALDTVEWAGAKEVADEVAECLGDEAGRVRLRAVGALRSFRVGRIEALDRAAREDESSAVREAAKYALEGVVTSERAVALGEAIVAKKRTKQQEALLEKPSLTAACCDELFRSPHVPVRRWAAESAGKFGLVDGSGNFYLALQDADPGVRAAGAASVARTASARFARDVAPLLNDRDDAVRAAAVEAVGWTGDVREARTLHRALQDGSAAVRAQAVDALMRLGGGDVPREWPSILRSMIRDKDRDVRIRVLLAVSELDARARGAIEIPADDMAGEGAPAWSKAAEKLARARMANRTGDLAALIDDVSTKPELASLAEPLLAALAEAYEADTVEKLRKAAANYTKDLRDALKEAGIELQGDLKNVPKGNPRLPARHHLARVARANGGVLSVEGGGRLRLTSSTEALKYWQKRLKE